MIFLYMNINSYQVTLQYKKLVLLVLILLISIRSIFRVKNFLIIKVILFLLSLIMRMELNLVFL
jgi:hypothetical protein